MIDNRVVMWLVGLGGVLVAALVCGFLAAVISSSTVYPRDDAGLKKDYHSDQCERPTDRSSIAEHQNTWSNLAYLLAGLLVLARARAPTGILLGVNLVLLAFASGLYHATLEYRFQILDMIWVYAALFSLILQCSYVFTRSRSLTALPGWVCLPVALVQLGMFVVMLQAFAAKEVVAFLVLSALIVPAVQFLLILINRSTGQPAPWYWWLTVTVVLGVVGFWSRTRWDWDSSAVAPLLLANVVVLGLLVVMVLAEASQKRSHNRIYDKRAWLLIVELVVIAGVAAIGFAAKLFDGYAHDGSRMPLCDPDLFIQAHAVWHIFSAAALVLVYDLMTQFEPRDAGPTRANLPVIFPDLGGTWDSELPSSTQQ